MLKIAILLVALSSLPAGAQTVYDNGTRNFGDGTSVMYEGLTDYSNSNPVSLAELIGFQAILSSDPNVLTYQSITHQNLNAPYPARNDYYTGVAVYSAPGTANAYTESTVGGWFTRFYSVVNGTTSNSGWIAESTGSDTSLPLDAGSAPLALGLAVFALKKRFFAKSAA